MSGTPSLPCSFAAPDLCVCRELGGLVEAAAFDGGELREDRGGDDGVLEERACAARVGIAGREEHPFAGTDFANGGGCLGQCGMGRAALDEVLFHVAVFEVRRAILLERIDDAGDGVAPTCGGVEDAAAVGEAALGGGERATGFSASQILDRMHPDAMWCARPPGRRRRRSGPEFHRRSRESLRGIRCQRSSCPPRAEPRSPTARLRLAASVARPFSSRFIAFHSNAESAIRMTTPGKPPSETRRLLPPPRRKKGALLYAGEADGSEDLLITGGIHKPARGATHAQRGVGSQRYIAANGHAP